MYRTLVIYASRYGPTEGAAKIIFLVLGPSRLTRPEGFAEGYRDVGFVVLGTHVYQGSVALEMEAFVQDNKEWLKARMAVLLLYLSGPEGRPQILGKARRIYWVERSPA